MHKVGLNCNVMKSCDQSRDGSNLIGTISDHYWSRIPRGWLSHQSPDLPNQPSDFRINILNQPFKSTFQINLLNQPFESTYAISLLIKSAAPLACGTSLSLTNIHTWKSTSIYWGTYDSGSWPSCRSPTCRGVKYITLKHSLVAVWKKALLDATRTSPLCKRQLRLQESQNDENDKGLDSRPVALRPDEYVGLDLTWLDVETSTGARLESWGISG